MTLRVTIDEDGGIQSDAKERPFAPAHEMFGRVRKNRVVRSLPARRVS